MARRLMLLGAATAIALLGFWTWGGESRRIEVSDSTGDGAVAEASDYSAHPAPTSAQASAVPVSAESAAPTRFVVNGGTLRFDFDRAALAPLDLGFVARGAVEETTDGGHVAFDISADSTMRIEAPGGALGKIVTGDVQSRGALLLNKPGDRVVIGNFAVGVDDKGRYHVRTTLNSEREGEVVFEMASIMVDFIPATQELFIGAELAIDPAWAGRIELPEGADVRVGTVQVKARLLAQDGPTTDAEGLGGTTCYVPPDRAGRTTGSDVVVGDLQSVKYYGRAGDIHAYAVGTHACNYGDQRANWIAGTNQHPVIIQDMFRLKNHRFEHIGMSWVKHGFYAVSWDFCGLGCPDPTDGTQLGVGCSDPYSASLNGVQSNMSRHSDVNPHTGYFPYPWTAPEPEPVIGKRLQVHEVDLDPDLNAGALYFVQGHYVHPNDAAAGTQDNNASYRQVTVTESGPREFTVSPVGVTRATEPAIRAWQDTDPSVVVSEVHVPNEGLFLLAAKSVELGTGTWRYEFAVQNLNSDRAGASFSVPLPDGAVVNGVGFHDVDYHSGEIYDHADWPAVIEGGAITWATTGAYVEGNDTANALRFNTLYNFYFEANVEPATTTATIGLHKPGFPSEITGTTIGPKLDIIDCNGNDIADQCDISCEAEGCEWPCGGSIDCNSNGVPDECEVDCNHNGVADSCDMLTCDGSPWCDDCNANTILDVCEPDCDENGIPDDCVIPADTDGDTVWDCVDLCPLTTPPNTCSCPLFGECCWQNGQFCLDGYTAPACFDLGGVPSCVAAPCQSGCVLGDHVGDGDLDLQDYWALQLGYSGPNGAPGFVTPPQEYWLIFDVDEDEDIDLDDYKSFEAFMCGPDAAPRYFCE